jgi:acyl-CoA thioester hydrolase
MLRAEVPVAFSVPARVYYQDTDAGGVVFHGTYLDFFERARTEWLRHLGFDVRTVAERDGVLFIVRQIRIDYSRPALLDDLLTLTVGVEHLGRAQFTFVQQALRAGELLARASVNLACVSPGTFKPLRVPDELRAALIERGTAAAGLPLAEDG